MGSLSNTYEIAALKAMLGSSRAAGFPTPIYLGLFSVTPSDSTFGTEIKAIGTAGYARVSIANTDAEWNTSATPATNINVLTFPTVVTTDWGTAAGWALLDSSTATAAANIIFWGTWATAKTCQVGETPFVPAGGLTIGAD